MAEPTPSPAPRPDDGSAPKKSEPADFAAQADAPNPSLIREFFDFIRHDKIWWMVPILLVLLVVGLLIILSGTVIAPFIYPLF